MLVSSRASSTRGFRTMSESIHDDTPAEAGQDDSAVGKAFQDPGVLQVYQTGELTVVGFAGKDVPDEVCIAGYRDQMNKLIEEHNVKVMAVDLSGVKLVPSGMLGLLTSIRKRVDKVELYNPSDDVREVLRITNLEKLFEIKTVQF
jgi:anti-sigma B factor antagonist